jgi:flagellin-like protein
MNFEKVRRKNRKAISPVLATVILIAITLIAAIAIAGFVFGLFGSFTSSPQLTSAAVSCGNVASAGAPAAVVTPSSTYVAADFPACTMNLANSGSGSAGVPSSACSIDLAGHTTAGILYLNGPAFTAVTSVAGNTAPEAAVCIGQTAFGTSIPASGSTAGGSITTSSATVPYSGTWD